MGEHVAGALIALMLGTGQALEGSAQRRAHRDLDALLARAPRTARVRRADAVVSVPAGDVVVVRSGEVVPVDGRLLEPGTFDESALTGEPLPVARETDAVVRSGVSNAGTSVAMRAAERSAYAGVVRLPEQALAGRPAGPPGPRWRPGGHRPDESRPAEIERLTARLGRHLAGPPTPDQVDDLRATLYGLDVVLTLHFAQEEQDYFTLADRERRETR